MKKWHSGFWVQVFNATEKAEMSLETLRSRFLTFNPPAVAEERADLHACFVGSRRAFGALQMLRVEREKFWSVQKFKYDLHIM